MSRLWPRPELLGRQTPGFPGSRPRWFETVWQLHPAEYHEIMIHGRRVTTPRWPQAFGVGYGYSGQLNEAFPIPPSLESLLGWAKESIDERLNGLLLNWYDGSLGHYIGRHRDGTKNVVCGAPIVTMSFGEARIFRLRPWPASATGEKMDFLAQNGSVFVMPYETNLAFTHEVPTAKRWTGKRISVTVRGFVPVQCAMNI